MKETAVIYARFSSHNQTEQSIEGQLRECYEFAKRNNYRVIGEYIDRAISGTSDKRPDFLRMIEDSKKKAFQYVIVYQLDRFSRNRYDSATYKAKLKKNGIKVLSARENISNDASGVLMESVLEGMAEYYSVELAQKVKRGIMESLLKGNYTGGIVPLGYKIVDKKWTVDENDAKIVKDIFEKYCSGVKAYQIADELNNKGLRTNTHKQYNTKIIARILRCKKYIGLYETKTETYTNITPRIISDELFEKANKLLDNHKSYQRDTDCEIKYYLTGKLFCGHCLTPMTSDSGTSKHGVVYRYYKCGKRKNHHKHCFQKTIPQEKLESKIFEHVRKTVLQPEIIDDIAKIVTKRFNDEVSDDFIIDKIKNDIKNNKKAIENIMNGIKQGIYTNTTKDELLKLEREQEELEYKLSVEENKKVPLLKEDNVRKFLEFYAKHDFSNVSERNDFFKNFIKRILVFDDKVTVILNTSNDYQTEIEIEQEKDIKNSIKPQGFNRESYGGDGGTWTHTR